MGALEVMLLLRGVVWCRWAGRPEVGGRLDESERALPRLELLLSFFAFG